MSSCKAVVLLSGGQDSTTCLYWALDRGFQVHCVSFSYGQRHLSEMEASREIAKLAGVPRTTLDLGILGEIGNSALVDPTWDILPSGGLPDKEAPGGLPTSFVPGRNILMLTAAAAFAVKWGAKYVIGGMSQADYSGYPDCRRDTIDALETVFKLGLGSPVEIITPVMHLTKAQEVVLARSLSEDCWKALALTITCYNGRRPGCGKCPACLLRHKGFFDAGFQDPAEVQA